MWYKDSTPGGFQHANKEGICFRMCNMEAFSETTMGMKIWVISATGIFFFVLGSGGGVAHVHVWTLMRGTSIGWLRLLKATGNRRFRMKSFFWYWPGDDPGSLGPSLHFHYLLLFVIILATVCPCMALFRRHVCCARRSCPPLSLWLYFGVWTSRYFWKNGRGVIPVKLLHINQYLQLVYCTLTFASLKRPVMITESRVDVAFGDALFRTGCTSC